MTGLSSPRILRCRRRTIYTPRDFRVDDLETLHADMRRASLATLVTLTPTGLVATHLPVLIEQQDSGYGLILGHVSRANLQWQQSDLSLESLVIFTGPETYVTPSWYAAKQENGRVVPTWNYAAVHAYGPLTFFDDPERLRQIVTRLTDLHEASTPSPWKVSDAPAVYIDSQLKAIVGFEMPIHRIEGKRKFNQNRSAADRTGVLQGLRELGKTEAAAMMEEIESNRGS